ncbi:MAG: 4-hydroxy-tetrahydrodipicolinate synthase [Tissierellia bacterium]|nr:4-hydroxy-tetrahydrodipicolinate synthase [Tissierellia bacterium]
MTLFKGSGVALVTPFDDNNNIDFDELGRLIDFQIENNTDAIIIVGTTGEASTMTDEEQISVIKYTVDRVNKKIPVIAGTGSNDTRHGINLSKMAEEAGADGLLQVTPYYNKTTQDGLKKHFLAIADSVNIPILLYTVPGRTGMGIEPETVKELSAHKNIVGLKDATGDLGYTVKVRSLCDENFAIYSGNDDIITPILSVGGVGVISVLANCAPQETHDLVYSYLNGDIKKSCSLQLKYKKFIDILFRESSPIPVKKALEFMGYKTENLRLPLSSASKETEELLIESMKEVNLL